MCPKYALKTETPRNRHWYHDSRSGFFVRNNFQMDDYLELSSSIEEALLTDQGLVKMITESSITLTKFDSKIQYVLSTFNQTDIQTKAKVKVSLAEKKSSDVMGLTWISPSDTTVVSRGTSLDQKRTLTPKVMLSLVSTVYDPIGLVTSSAYKYPLLFRDNCHFSG